MLNCRSVLAPQRISSERISGRSVIELVRTRTDSVNKLSITNCTDRLGSNSADRA